MMYCACGEPLHYQDFATKKVVDKLIALKGSHVDVTCGGKRYRVQRHYISLHGLKGSEMEHLAKIGHIEELPPQ